MILKEAKITDWKLLLDWRNEAEARKNSHTNAIVSPQAHKEWLHNSIVNSNRRLYIAFDNETPIGTVRADFEDGKDIYVLSWTVAPQFRGKGFGKRMVKLLVTALKGQAKAEIIEGNKASIKIAEYAGLIFKEKREDILYYWIKK